MNPIRLALLCCLLYSVYRLFLSTVKQKRTDKQSDTHTDRVPSSKATDVLVEDPLCHTLVPQGQAIPLQQNNQLYYFCSDTCYHRFLNEQGDK